MALRKAWQQMKRTLSLEARQFLVTSELWEIFLAKDQKNHTVIDKLLEKILDRINLPNEKGNFGLLINVLSRYFIAYQLLSLQEKS